jgi:DNA-binding XRE family transcriptional regulator
MGKINSPKMLGAAVRKRRKSLHLTQEDVALAIGVSRKTINELESGKASVELRIALEAGRAVGLDLWAEERGGIDA